MLVISWPFPGRRWARRAHHRHVWAWKEAAGLPATRASDRCLQMRYKNTSSKQLNENFPPGLPSEVSQDV